MTLQTDVKVTICRTELKTDECSVGTDLPFKEMLELKKKDVLGTGKYIKLTNKIDSYRFATGGRCKIYIRIIKPIKWHIKAQINPTVASLCI